MARTRKSALTERDEALAQGVVDGLTIRDAATAAGYTHPMSGYAAMRRTEIIERIATIRNQVVDLTMLKKIDVIEGIFEAIEHARLIADPGTMIRGYAEVAKMLGFYEPEKKIIELTTSQGRMRQKFEVMTDEELLQVMNGELIEGEATVVN